MKQLIYVLFCFSFIGLLSCSNEDSAVPEEETNEEMKSGGEVSEEEDPPMEGFVGFNTECLILFTDPNNVSVFDKSGYNWVANDIKVHYLVDGKEQVFMDRFDQSHLPLLENTSGIGVDPGYPNWVGIAGCNLFREVEEYTTILLKFPDATVDTLYCLEKMYIQERNGKLSRNGVYTEKVWYNSELKYDMENLSLNPEVFFDGRERGYDRMFHIIK